MINKSTNKKSVHDYEIEVAKFWSGVAVGADDECWNWQRGKNTTGYGLFRVKNTHGEWERTGRSSTQILAHRVALSLVRQVMPHDYVIHRCDNRLCCNPSHLRIGASLDNHQDMCAKGRAAWQNGYGQPFSRNPRK